MPKDIAVVRAVIVDSSLVYGSVARQRQSKARCHR